jgi:hypothetical protein
MARCSSSALAAAVDQAVADVETRTLGRFKVSWHVPDTSVSTEGFDLENWDDLCKRSRPADTDADMGRRRLHLMALRDTQTQRERMAGYAKIKLLNEHTLPPQAAADLLGALARAEGGVSTAAATERLCGGIGYLGCVVVGLIPVSLLADTRSSNLLGCSRACWARHTTNGKAAASARYCAFYLYSMHCASYAVGLSSLTQCILRYGSAYPTSGSAMPLLLQHLPLLGNLVRPCLTLLLCSAQLGVDVPHRPR